MTRWACSAGIISTLITSCGATTFPTRPGTGLIHGNFSQISSLIVPEQEQYAMTAGNAVRFFHLSS